jgi:heme-degrading monooxygenase HmoA
MWRGRVPSPKAEEYRAYQEEVGPPGYRKVPGNRGIYMIGRHLGQQYEIAMVTFWESWESIRDFAGDPVDRAKYYDRDLDFLIDPPEKVQHFDVLATENAGPASILRLWRAPVELLRKEEAIRREGEIGIPGYRRIAGNTGIFLIGRELEGRYEIGMVTLWASWESIRRFAGDPVDRADYSEYRRRRLDYLAELPEVVEHFDVLVQEGLVGP